MPSLWPTETTEQAERKEREVRNEEGKIWLVLEGDYYGECQPLFACNTKAEAFRVCRGDGFVWNGREGLFLDNKWNVYRRVKAILFCVADGETKRDAIKGCQ